MRWDDFELLVGELFRRRGYSVEVPSGLGADGGKDLTVRKDGQLFVVQCKKLAAANRVTAAQMRDFFGLITAEGAAKGFFVTTGYFSSEAQRFAEGKPIVLVDPAKVQSLINEVSMPGENLCDIGSWIDGFTAEAKIVDPTCPRCQESMKLKRGAGGGAFWGCSTFPRCRGKREAREQLLARLVWQGGS
jgi:restriction system protein